jgi:hypothetical protein
MTLGELERATASRVKMEKRRAQEKATYDNILADLKGKSIARIYNSANRMPDISEVYPTLFDGKKVEAKRQEQRAKLSAARFKQFAQSFNQNFNKEVAKD